MKLSYILGLLIALSASPVLNAQDFAVKTDILDDVTLSPGLAGEMKLAPRWTVDVSGSFNLWNIGDRRWRHWKVQPEGRYWFCEAFSGHFVGAHVLGGQYNIGHLPLDFKFLGTDFSKLRDYRFQGWMAGAGVAYGYSWILNRHWNIEAEIGIGWVYTRYSQYRCADCGKKVKSNRPHNYFGPTKTAVNLVYTF